MDRELAKRPHRLSLDRKAVETRGGANCQRAGAGRFDSDSGQRPASGDHARRADRGRLSQARPGGCSRCVMAGAMPARADGAVSMGGPCCCNNWRTKRHLKLAKRGHRCELALLANGPWKGWSADRPKFKRQPFVTIETGNRRENFMQR